jgi:phosphopantetheinyl transferase (holo-ACP synthase)
VGLGVNAGHDLNRDNLADFLRVVPGVQEVSIGHALIADALELGIAETVRDYLRCIHGPSRRHDLRHRHRHLRRAPHRGHAGAARRAFRRACARARRTAGLPRPPRAGAEVRGVRYLATRFSAKEAFSKAIGLGIRMPMTWRACEILNQPERQALHPPERRAGRVVRGAGL